MHYLQQWKQDGNWRIRFRRPGYKPVELPVPRGYRGDKLQATLISSIEAGVRDGSIRSDIGSPMLMSVTLWGFMHGIIQLTTTKAHALAHHGVAPKALIDYAISMITRDLKN